MSGNSWVKTDRTFAYRAKWFTISLMELRLDAGFIGNVGRGTVNLFRHLYNVLTTVDTDPSTIERAFLELFYYEYPELKGGCVLMMRMQTYDIWEFLVEHSSFEEVLFGKKSCSSKS